MKAINRAGNLKRITTHARKRTRQQEAKVRQAAHDALTKEQKLAKLDFAPGESKRERAGLLK